MKLIEYKIVKDQYYAITKFLGSPNMLNVIDIQKEVGNGHIRKIESINITSNWIVWPIGKMKNIVNRNYYQKDVNIKNNHIFIPSGAISFSKYGSNLLAFLSYNKNYLYFEISKPNWVMKNIIGHQSVNSDNIRFSVTLKEFLGLAQKEFDIEHEKNRIEKEKLKIRNEKARITREKNKKVREEKRKKAELAKLKKELAKKELLNNPNRYTNPNLTVENLRHHGYFGEEEKLFYIKIIIGRNTNSTFRVMHELLGYLPANSATEAKKIISEGYYKRYGFPYELVEIVKINKSNLYKFTHVRVGPTFSL